MWSRCFIITALPLSVVSHVNVHDFNHNFHRHLFQSPALVDQRQDDWDDHLQYIFLNTFCEKYLCFYIVHHLGCQTLPFQICVHHNDMNQLTASETAASRNPTAKPTVHGKPHKKCARMATLPACIMVWWVMFLLLASTSMKQGMKVALATITRNSHSLSGSSSRPALNKSLSSLEDLSPLAPVCNGIGIFRQSNLPFIHTQKLLSSLFIEDWYISQNGPLEVESCSTNRKTVTNVNRWN